MGWLYNQSKSVYAIHTNEYSLGKLMKNIYVDIKNTNNSIHRGRGAREAKGIVCS